ncbi:MAG: hypothetical protein V4858_19370 [Pseudomonadota bacterium]
MSLQYLIFDASEDGEGNGSWEAMASVRTPQLTALRAEIQTLLAWAETHSPGPRGPLDDGGVWDADQHTQTDGDWTTLTFTLVGPWAWGEALLSQFAPDGD